MTYRKPPVLPNPIAKVPRPTPPKFHVDRDKTPIPGIYSDPGAGFGGNPARRPPSLPPAVKLGPLLYRAEQDAERHAAEANRTRTYTAEEIDALVQRESRARGQSAKMAAARDLEAHERSDKRVLAFWTAVAVAFVGGLSMIGKAIVDNSGRQNRLETQLEATEAAAKRVEAMIRPLAGLSEKLQAEQDARRRDVDRLEAKIDRLPTANPDLVSAVRRGVAARDATQ